jgi:hypothetical protein
MNRINMLRKHDKTDPHRLSRKVGWCDPRIADESGGGWHLYWLEWPPADKIWFVCAPNGRPFPHSWGYTPAGAITGFLNIQNLPKGKDKYGRLIRHTEEPERSRWWRWFRTQGYFFQCFEVNPPPQPAKDIMEILKYQLKFERQRSDGCIWCKGAERFRIIAARLQRMIEAIDYYSVRPEEQERWLESMNQLWAAKNKLKGEV